MIQDDFGNLVDPATTAGIHQRLDTGDARMTRIESDVAGVRRDLSDNTRATQAVADNTRDLVELFEAMKGALKVLNWVGKLAKPMAYIVGFGTAALGFWGALKGHLK